MKHLWLALTVCTIVTAACARTSSTTAPTPGTKLTFVEDVSTPVGEAIAIKLASRDQLEGMVTLAVSGFNIRNLNGTGTSAVDGRVTWDPALLMLDAVDVGDWFAAGGGMMICCHYPLQDPPGAYTFNVARENGAALKIGSGEMFLFRLKRVSGVTSGSSAIEFAQFNQFPPVYLSPNVARPLDNLYGGRVTIR